MIWVFGDSFSCRMGHESMGAQVPKYVKWKGYEPKVFGDVLSEHYNVPVNNLAIGGFDNYSIFESVMANAHQMQQDDIIFIGWSDITRTRVANHNKFYLMLANNLSRGKLSDVSLNTMNEILVNRTQPLFFDEFKIKFDFINWVFRDYTLIQWTPFYGFLDNDNGANKQINCVKSGYSNIWEESLGLIDDAHLSETGHKALAEHFKTLIESKELRDENNVLYRKPKSLF